MGLVHSLSVVAVVALFTGQSPPTPSERPAPSVVKQDPVAAPTKATIPESPSMVSSGTRYWNVIETYLDPESEASRTLRQRRAMRGTVDRSYNFDKIRMLDASFLVLAARSSINRTRYEMRGSTEDVLERKFIENFDLCFQYYPLLADSDEDFEAILDAMRHLKGNKHFRTYLIRRTVPGLEAGSLFASYLQENLAPRRRELQTILQKLIMYREEDPMVASASLDVLVQLPRYDIQQALAADPAVAAWETEQGKPFNPALLRDEDAPSLAYETSNTCNSALRELSTLTRFLIERRNADRINSPYVRERIGDVIRRVCREFPLPDAEEILALLAETDDA